MGYPMAVNLRNKIGNHKAMVVCDVNQLALEKFRSGIPGESGPVSIASTPVEAITLAVGFLICSVASNL